MKGLSVSIGKSPIVLDTCVIINLYASQRFDRIVDSFVDVAVVSERVMRMEALECYDGPENDIRSRSVAIDLASSIASRKLILAPFTEEEEELFVDLVIEMKDDGEAATGALALSRGYVMATDDIKATRAMRSRKPDIRVLTTPEIVKQWADTLGISEEEVRQTIHRIRYWARYTPPDSHPLREWWRQWED